MILFQLPLDRLRRSRLLIALPTALLNELFFEFFCLGRIWGSFGNVFGRLSWRFLGSLGGFKGFWKFIGKLLVFFGQKNCETSFKQFKTICQNLQRLKFLKKGAVSSFKVLSTCKFLRLRYSYRQGVETSGGEAGGRVTITVCPHSARS